METVPDQDIVRIKCPSLSCQRVLAVPTKARGKLVKCRACGCTLRVPQKGQQGPDDSAASKQQAQESG